MIKVLREFERSFTKDLSKQKPKNGSLSASVQARNTKLARCRIVIKHTFDYLKKWNILADCYRGQLPHPQIFKVDETTVCRAIRRIAPLAEQVLKIKPEKLLSENDLQLLIVDATEQRIERPKNQRDYYSGEKHAHTIKTEIVTDSKGRIFQVSKPYEGRVHDFEIRKTEGPLPSIPILADSGYKAFKTNIQLR